MLGSAMLALRSRAGATRVLAVGAAARSRHPAPRAHAAWNFELGIGEQGRRCSRIPASPRSGSSTCAWSPPTTSPAARAPRWDPVDTWLAAPERAGAKPLVAFSLSWRPRRGCRRTDVLAVLPRLPRALAAGGGLQPLERGQPLVPADLPEPAEGGRLLQRPAGVSPLQRRGRRPAGLGNLAGWLARYGATCADGHDSGRCTTTST